MSPATGGAAAPTQPASASAAPTQPASASAALAPAAMIAATEPDRAAPPPRENLRDPAAQIEEADAAARKTAWNVPPQPHAAAAAPGGGIMGGDESWLALAEAARAWPKSASSDSLKSLSDGSAPSAPALTESRDQVHEDLVVPSQPVSNPISAGPNPTSTSPPPNATAAGSSRQNGSTNQPNLVRHGGGGGNNGGGSGRSTANNSSSDGNIGSVNDANWNDGGLGGGSRLNSSIHHSGNISATGSGIDSSRRVLGSNNLNGTGRSVGSSSNNGTSSGDGSNRNSGSGGGGNPWNDNARNGSGSSNGFGGRGGRNRREHERGSSFSPRNYPRASPVPHQQQHPGIYQPGPPPPAHFMVPQPFVPYVPPFAYPADAQAYPFFITSVEHQFQNMHLVQQPMQPLWVQQDQLSLQEDIRQQLEFYFSTNNLCHDTYLRRHMDDQGWVPIDLLAGFPRMRRFTMAGVDINYILDAIRDSQILEVQGNNVRRRNDWAEWLLH